MSDPVLEKYAAERVARTHSSRSFEFEGEQFTYKAAVPVDVLAAFLDRDEALPITDVTALCDRTAKACLEPSCHEAWDRIRSPDHQPLILDYQAILWLTDQLIIRASGLPTERPVASPTGPQEATAPISEGASSLAAATPIA